MAAVVLSVWLVAAAFHIMADQRRDLRQELEEDAIRKVLSQWPHKGICPLAHKGFRISPNGATCYGASVQTLKWVEWVLLQTVPKLKTQEATPYKHLGWQSLRSLLATKLKYQAHVEEVPNNSSSQLSPPYALILRTEYNGYLTPYFGWQKWKPIEGLQLNQNWQKMGWIKSQFRDEEIAQCFNYESEDLSLDPENTCKATHGSTCLWQDQDKEENPQMCMGQLA